MQPHLLKGFERVYNVSVFAGQTGAVEEVVKASSVSMKTREECEKELRLLL
jgi:hypothetical protein